MINTHTLLQLILSIALAWSLSGCSRPPSPLVISADIDVLLFMPLGVQSRMKQEMFEFLAQQGYQSMWIDMQGKNDKDVTQRIQTIMQHRNVQHRVKPLTLIGFSIGNAGVLAAMGYWGHPPLTEHLRAVFLAPPPNEILDRSYLYRLSKGHTMAFVYGAYDQPRRRRLLQQSQFDRQTVFETTVAARHALSEYWLGAQDVILATIRGQLPQ